jgi:hypothetical protein
MCLFFGLLCINSMESGKNQAGVQKYHLLIMIVTNHARGGIIISTEQALAANRSNFDYNKALNDLNEICYKICSALDSHFSFCKLGLDMTIDNNEKIWFIEANTNPDQDMFRKLGDQRI